MMRERPAYGVRPKKPGRPKRSAHPGNQNGKLRMMADGGGFGLTVAEEMRRKRESANAPVVAGNGAEFGSGPWSSSTPGAPGPQAPDTSHLPVARMSPLGSTGVTSLRGTELGTKGGNMPTSAGQPMQAAPKVYESSAPPSSIADPAYSHTVPSQPSLLQQFGDRVGTNSIFGDYSSNNTPARRSQTFTMNDNGQYGRPTYYHADGKADSVRDGQHMWGMVEGPGGPKEDKVGPAKLPGSGEDAMLSDGEAVIPADVVQSMNRDFFNKDPDGVEKYSLVNHKNPVDKQDFARRLENVGGPMALKDFAASYADGKKPRKCSGGKNILRLQAGQPYIENDIPPTVGGAADVLGNTRQNQMSALDREINDTGGGVTKVAAANGEEVRPMAQVVADVPPVQDPGAPVRQLTTAEQAASMREVNALAAKSQAEYQQKLADFEKQKNAQQKPVEEPSIADKIVTGVTKTAGEVGAGLTKLLTERKDGSPLRSYKAGKPVKKFADGGPEPGRVMTWGAQRYARGDVPQKPASAPAPGLIARGQKAVAGALGKVASTGAKLGGLYTIGDAVLDSEDSIPDRFVRGTGGALMMSKNPLHQLGGAAVSALPAAKDWALEEAYKAFLPAWQDNIGLGGDRTAAPQAPTGEQAPQAPQAPTGEQAPQNDAGMVVPNPSMLPGRTPAAAVPATGEIYPTGHNAFSGVGTKDTSESIEARMARELFRNAVWDNGSRSSEWIQKNAPRYLANQQTIQNAMQSMNNLDVARAQAQTKLLDDNMAAQRLADQTRRDASTKFLTAADAAAAGDDKRKARTLQQYGTYEPMMAAIPGEARLPTLGALVSAQDSQADDSIPVTPEYVKQALAMENEIAANPGMKEATLPQALTYGGMGGLKDYLSTIGSDKQVYDAKTGQLYRQMKPDVRAILRSQFPK